MIENPAPHTPTLALALSQPNLMLISLFVNNLYITHYNYIYSTDRYIHTQFARRINKWALCHKECQLWCASSISSYRACSP